MNDISAPANMQIMAYTDTQQLLYDASNSQLFYLYNPSTNQLTCVTGSAAKTFFQLAPNQSMGICSWGHTPVEGTRVNISQTTILISEGGAVLTTEGGQVLTTSTPVVIATNVVN